MSAERSARLETLPGWVWDPFDDQWEESFAGLTAFVARQGSARVSSKTKSDDGFPVGNWVSKQRIARRDGKLSAERRTRLEALPDWVWDPFDEQWEEGFTQLQTFAAREGSARVPWKSKTADGFALGDWVSKNATRAAKGKLSAERRARLEALPGWVWASFDEQWEEGFAHLQARTSREGSARVPWNATDNGFALGAWVSKQRAARTSGKLSAARRARLEALQGWAWDPFDDQWEKGFARVEAFSAREGSARLSSKTKDAEGFAVGNWVSKQRIAHREGKLSAERTARLEALPGWVWDPFEEQWEEGFAQLQAFAAREGSGRVPWKSKTADGFALGDWVSKNATRAAKGKLSAERRGRLEALPGWVWASFDDQWEEGFAHLQARTSREGSARVPWNATDNGFALGAWVSKQRAAHAGGRMSAERRARLDALPGWVWDPFDDQWEKGFARVKAFSTLETSARLSSKTKDADGFAVGNWASKQRIARRDGKLSAERTARLEALPGWAWSNE